MEDSGKARWHAVGEEGAGQRIDNYLIRVLKGVPRSHLYRILRTGEVRVNSRRVDATCRLKPGDRIRLPPVRTAQRAEPDQGGPLRHSLEAAILYEDDALLALDKPAGLAVHGGSGVSRGVIEELRRLRPQARFLELVHRLDRETSGVLLIAKTRAALTGLHAAIRTGRMRKHYAVLASGGWRERRLTVDLGLEKYVLAGGDRRVSVSEDGRPSRTVFTLRERIGSFSLLEAELLTGRTHQIRVHLAHLGFPIAGDDKYGDFALNRRLRPQGLKRMFLHAARVRVAHPLAGTTLALEAPLPADLESFLVHCRFQSAPVERKA